MLNSVAMTSSIIGADADALRSQSGEFGGEVTKVARLPGTAGGEGLWVEEQDDGTIGEHLGQTHRVSGLVYGGEVGSMVAGSHGAKISDRAPYPGASLTLSRYGVSA